MKKAFSLVELSIVLVILGLLTGGILAGQSLIRAAQLRAITTEFSRYYSATQAFRDKYFQLPGDFNNAQAFWGTANATPASCVTSTATGTCNGDSNGRIDLSTGSNEPFRFWQHLASAGLIEGNYSGVDGTPNTTVTCDTTNCPRSKLTPGLWFAYYFGTKSGDAGLFDGQYNNVLEVGTVASTGGNPWTPLLKPEEMWNIDTKMDDGQPGNGKVVMNGLFANCTTATATSPSTQAATAQYLLTSTSLGCAVVFRNLF